MNSSTPTAPAASPPGPVATFLDLIKFAHSVFALPFALIATFWAFRQTNSAILSLPTLGKLGLILVCMILARTYAMTVNRLVDRKFDAVNPRTARRPSVTGAVSVRFMTLTIWLCVLLFFAASSGFFVAFVNPWPLILALPVLAWLGGYSLTKRFTSLCHFWLGISLGLAPVSAWVALAPPQIPLLGPQSLTILLLGIGVAFWVAGFDILYALQDEEFDREHSLNSIPARVGRGRAILISRGCHLMTGAAFFAVGLTGGFHAFYWVGYAAAVLLLVVEQSLVSARDISKINIAFMTANGLIGIAFGTLAILDTILF